MNFCRLSCGLPTAARLRYSRASAVRFLLLETHTNKPHTPFATLQFLELFFCFLVMPHPRRWSPNLYLHTPMHGDRILLVIPTHAKAVRFYPPAGAPENAPDPVFGTDDEGFLRSAASSTSCTSFFPARSCSISTALSVSCSRSPSAIR